MQKIITFGTLKGGVGKTISVFNIAGILAESGKRVIVIDMDPQGNATNNFGIDRTKGNKSVKDIFENGVKFDEVVVRAPVQELPTLDAIPSSIFLAGTEMRIINLAGRERILANFLEDNATDIKEYDYVILDTNPSMSIINQNAFLVADSIILLSDVSMNALEGAELFIALWEESRRTVRKEDNVRGLLINNLDSRIKLSRDIVEYCRDHEDFKKLVFKTVIPMNVKLKESELAAKPINIYDKSSAGCMAFRKVVKEMIEREIF